MPKELKKVDRVKAALFSIIVGVTVAVISIAIEKFWPDPVITPTDELISTIQNTINPRPKIDQWGF